MQQTAWTIAGVVVSGVMAAFLPIMWRRTGPKWGLRYAALTLVPAGLALSHTLTLFGRLGRAIGSFVTSLIFSPTVWIGFGLLGLAVLLGLASRSERVKAADAAAPASSDASGSASTRAPAVAGRPRTVEAKKPTAGGDDEFGDIEEILRRRGIS